MLLRLTALLLAPVLLSQAKTVRRTLPRLPEADGARRGVAGCGATLRVLVTGDSAAAGVGATHQDEALAGQLVGCLSGDFQVHWQLLARSGRTTAQISAALSSAALPECDVAVVSAGVNDVLGRCTPRAWLHALDDLVDVLRRHCGVRLIVFAPLPPMHQFPALPQPMRWFLGQRAKAFNRALEHFVKAHPECRVLVSPFDFVPEMMASDGFHPGPPAYALWAKTAALETLRWAQSHDPALAVTVNAKL